MKKRNEEKYVKHTYRFYKDHRNDPKWRSTYLKERQKRIMWSVCTTLALLFIGTLAFFGYTYSNANSGKNVSTAAFEKTSSSSSSSTSSSSTTPSNSSVSKKALKTMDDLDLNTKIALLAQAYFDVNPNTTILEAPNICMSYSWNNGPIEWYDNQGNRHRLDTQVNGDTITFNYKDPQTGQQTTKTTSVDTAINHHLMATNAIHGTEAIAAKVVAPANLTPPTGGKGGGSAGLPETIKSPSGQNYLKDYFFKGNDISTVKENQLLQPVYEAAHGDISKFYGNYKYSDEEQIMIDNDPTVKTYFPQISFHNSSNGVGSDNHLINPIVAGNILSPGYSSSCIEYPFKDQYDKSGYITLQATTNPSGGYILSLETSVDGQTKYFSKIK